MLTQQLQVIFCQDESISFCKAADIRRLQNKAEFEVVNAKYLHTKNNKSRQNKLTRVAEWIKTWECAEDLQHTPTIKCGTVLEFIDKKTIFTTTAG